AGAARAERGGGEPGERGAARGPCHARRAGGVATEWSGAAPRARALPATPGGELARPGRRGGAGERQARDGDRGGGRSQRSHVIPFETPLFYLLDRTIQGESRVPPRAYSYIRFSTPEQMQGDSQRRQIALAESFAKRRG